MACAEALMARGLGAPPRALAAAHGACGGAGGRGGGALAARAVLAGLLPAAAARGSGDVALRVEEEGEVLEREGGVRGGGEAKGGGAGGGHGGTDLDALVIRGGGGPGGGRGCVGSKGNVRGVGKVLQGMRGQTLLAHSPTRAIAAPGQQQPLVGQEGAQRAPKQACVSTIPTSTRHPPTTHRWREV